MLGLATVLVVYSISIGVTPPGSSVILILPPLTYPLNVCIEVKLRASRHGKVKAVCDLFHDVSVRPAVGTTAVLSRLRADLPAAAQRLVDADNGKPLVGACDCQRTPACKVGPFSFEYIQVDAFTC